MGMSEGREQASTKVLRHEQTDLGPMRKESRPTISRDCLYGENGVQ